METDETRKPYAKVRSRLRGAINFFVNQNGLFDWRHVGTKGRRTVKAIREKSSGYILCVLLHGLTTYCTAAFAQATNQGLDLTNQTDNARILNARARGIEEVARIRGLVDSLEKTSTS